MVPLKRRQRRFRLMRRRTRRQQRRQQLRYTAARAVDLRRAVAAVAVVVLGGGMFVSFRHLLATLKNLSMIPPFVYSEKSLRSNDTTIPTAELQRYFNEHRIGCFNAAKHCVRLKEMYPEIAGIRCAYVPPAGLHISVSAKHPVLYRAGDPPVFFTQSGSSFTARIPQMLMGSAVRYVPTGGADPYPAVVAVNYLSSLRLVECLEHIEGMPNGEMVFVLRNGSRIVADTNFSTHTPSTVHTVFALAASSNTDVYARLLDDGRLVVRERGRGAR